MVLKKNLNFQPHLPASLGIKLLNDLTNYKTISLRKAYILKYPNKARLIYHEDITVGLPEMKNKENKT